jgi:hypothetical protein
MPLLARAIQAQHQIKSLDAEHSKLRSLEAIQKKQMDKNQKQTARTIFKTRKEGPTRPMPGPQDSHGYSHRRPQTHQGDRRAALPCPGAAPSGHKHGTYQTTSDARTDYPGTAGRSRLVQTGNRATNLATRPWLHNSINDKAAFDRSINKLAWGKPRA